MYSGVSSIHTGTSKQGGQIHSSSPGIKSTSHKISGFGMIVQQSVNLLANICNLDNDFRTILLKKVRVYKMLASNLQWLSFVVYSYLVFALSDNS